MSLLLHLLLLLLITEEFLLTYLIPSIVMLACRVVHVEFWRNRVTWVLCRKMYVRILIEVLTTIYALTQGLLFLLQSDEMVVLRSICGASSVGPSIEDVPKNLPPFVNETLWSVHCHFRFR